MGNLVDTVLDRGGLSWVFSLFYSMNPFVYVHSLPCPQGYCAGWHCPGWVVLDAVTLVPLGPVAGKGIGKGKGKGLCVTYFFFPSCSLFFL